MPLCTVAIPSYNRQEMIRKALDSALAQEVRDLEVLVVDDCSTDNTWDTLRSYADPRLRIVRNERNQGLFGNFNRCLELAQGDYLRIVCNDDRLVPGCLQREVELMERHPEVVLISTYCQGIDESYAPRSIIANHFRPGLYRGDTMIGSVLWALSHYAVNPLNYPSGILLRREAALRAGRFDGSFQLVGDLDYWMRVLQQGDMAIMDHIGCEVMMHANQVGSSVFDNGKYYEEWFALAERWKPNLQSQGIERQVREQIAACSIWAMSYMLRRKRPHVAKLYWKTAVSRGIAPLALTRAVARFIRMQLLLRRRGLRMQLVPPYATLTKNAIESEMRV